MIIHIVMFIQTVLLTAPSLVTVLVQAKEQSVLSEQAFSSHSVDASSMFCRGRDLHEHGQCPTSQPWGQRMAPATPDGAEWKQP